jgi:hypothetical protein
VETKVPKIPKMPVEMRMITYDDDLSSSLQGNKLDIRSNVSSARSLDESLTRRRLGSDEAESSDTIGHKNADLFKPFNKKDSNLTNQQEGGRATTFNLPIF